MRYFQWRTVLFSISVHREIWKGYPVETIDIEFRELQVRAGATGLFEKTYGFYIGQAVMILTLCVASLCMLVFMEGFWVRVVANAVLLAAFASGQTGFLMHEVVHKQVFKPSGWYTLVCACLDFFLGSSTTWWEKKHNIGHHLHSNDPNEDPDVMKMTFVAFTPEYAKAKRGVYRFTTHHQHQLLPVLLLFQPLHMRFAAAQWLCKEKPAGALVGLSLIGLHLVAYLGILFLLLPFWHAVAFAFLHNASLGLYFGVSFLVNHTGMQIQPTDKPGDFCAQVLTARNISGGWLLSFILGWLNYQIEHHLCPEMPSSHYQEFAELVKELCGKEQVEYHCVSFWKACTEVYVHLRTIAKFAA